MCIYEYANINIVSKFIKEKIYSRFIDTRNEIKCPKSETCHFSFSLRKKPHN